MESIVQTAFRMSEIEEGLSGIWRKEGLSFLQLELVIRFSPQILLQPLVVLVQKVGIKCSSSRYTNLSRGDFLRSLCQGHDCHNSAKKITFLSVLCPYAEKKPRLLSLLQLQVLHLLGLLADALEERRGYKVMINLLLSEGGKAYTSSNFVSAVENSSTSKGVDVNVTQVSDEIYSTREENFVKRPCRR
ncbi:hypothetical protein V6N13_075512 [Hibiscus sabdariffa]|uniref:Uncharacterized protein n=1 Tax=Hibiscus sabdariffa TaxID=183260 RepID=A0ABR2UBS0_9ROSI